MVTTNKKNKKNIINIDKEIYLDNSNLYKKSNKVYDIGYNSTLTTLPDLYKDYIVNPTYVLIGNLLELIYSIESKRLLILDKRSNQCYLLSDENDFKKFISKLDYNTRKLLEAIRNEYWTTTLEFDKLSIKVLKYSEYKDSTSSKYLKEDKELDIVFKDYKDIEVLYEGLRILMITIIKEYNNND